MRWKIDEKKSGHSHMNTNSDFSEDYCEILGVTTNAGSDEIRAAYLEKVKEFPPDRSPAEFEKIREAYEMLRNPKYRIQRMIQTADRNLTFSSLIQEEGTKRNFVGPKLWLDTLKQK